MDLTFSRPVYQTTGNSASGVITIALVGMQRFLQAGEKVFRKHGQQALVTHIL